MATLAGNTIASTYALLLKIDNTGIAGDGTLRKVEDGDATDSALSLSDVSIAVDATDKIFLDGGGDTYIYESGADVLDFYVGGANMLKLTESTLDTIAMIGNTTLTHTVTTSASTPIGLLVDSNTSGVAAQDSVGLHVDFDRTVAGSGTAAHNDIGINLDVNSASLGTSSLVGMDIDVVGAASGTSTATGLAVTVGSADTNYAAVFSGGNVGIGIAAPDNLTHIYAGDASQTSNTTFTQLTVEHSGHSGINILSGTNSYGTIYFGDDGTSSAGIVQYGHGSQGDTLSLGTAGGIKMSIASAGDVTLTGDLIMANTKGISFAATADAATAGATMTSETLDDYEEGTWTPAMTYGTPGDLSIAHSKQAGIYTKIGNMVSIMFDLRLSGFTKGTASGSLIIGGLPFTTSDSANGGWGSLALYQATFTSQPIINAATSSTNLFLNRLVSNSVFAVLDDPDANAMYWGSIVYESA